jgi:hypothetical protein
MKKSQFSSEKLVLFESELNQLVALTEPILDSRMPGLISPNFGGTFRTCTKKDEDLILLAVVHWFLDDTWRVLVHVWLEQCNLQPENRVLMNLVLKNKTLALIWITENYHERRFFGNVLKLLKQELESLTPIPTKRKVPKRNQRRRGYQDHGTLRPLDRWREKDDWSFTEEQNRIEEERQVLLDTTNLLEGWYS